MQKNLKKKTTAAAAGTLEFAKKFNLSSLKSEGDKLDIDRKLY